MSNEIVDRLLRNHKKLEFLAEDVDPLYEADEDDEFEEASGADEEYAALTDEDSDSEDNLDLDNDEEVEANLEDDDSTAPEQGSPDDEEPEPDAIDLPSHSSGGSHPSFDTEEDTGSEEGAEEEAPEEEPVDPNVKEYDNPLDNQYAVKFTLGDDITMSYTGDAKEVRTGMIDGYDTEGFYRVKWSDGSSTNGLTDIALEELVKHASSTPQNESTCVCGSHNFVEENDEMICDDCGRKLNESALDALTIADKSRPKGKRMIRSMAHPVSTAVKPNIAEAIRKAFSGKSLNEGDDLEGDYSVDGKPVIIHKTGDDEYSIHDEHGNHDSQNADSVRAYIKGWKATKISESEDDEENAFDGLKKLENQFWTRKEEMKAEIEKLGYQVDELNDESVVVSSDEDDENAYLIPIEGTARTFYLAFDKARMI